MSNFFWWMTQLLTAVGLILILAFLVFGFVMLLQWVSEKLRLNFESSYKKNLMKELTRELANDAQVRPEVRSAEQPYDPDCGGGPGCGHDFCHGGKGRIFLGTPALRSEDPTGTDGSGSSDEAGDSGAGVEAVHSAGGYRCDNSRCDRGSQPHWHQAGDSTGGGIRYIRTDG